MSPRLKPLAIGLAAVLGLTGACFIEVSEPPSFRFGCQSDADCDGEERCIQGLCQIGCTLASFDEDCPDDTVACINGACAPICEVGAGTCPDPQSCLSLGSVGGFGGGSDAEIGVCGSLCDETDASTCPEGETCVSGFCAVACDPEVPDDCPDGQTCLAGVCVPEDP